MTADSTAGISEAEDAALLAAIDLARTSGVSKGPNPAVGCVLLDPAGTVIATGVHRGVGTAHAEADALAKAGPAARGATAVVSLEPCAHHGRTPPCAEALIDAGVAKVIYAQPDPNPQAAGGAQVLEGGGITVVGGVRAAEAREVNAIWSAAMALGRPWVHWKVAASLDGRIAAADGTSKWITSPLAREEVHRLRAECDAVLTGSGTALIDRPQLTARPSTASVSQQPLRVVMGYSDLPTDHPLADAVLLKTHDPAIALTELWSRGVRRVLLECGPRVAAAFVEADLIDEVTWFAAPLLLGEHGLAVVAGGPDTLTSAHRWDILRVSEVGQDVRIDMSRRRGND